MRVISGKFKSKRFYPPKNLPVRPTTDQAKESLFNILNNHFYFENLDVLDLFSGTGSMSYEFLSHEVNSVISIDANYNCVAYQKKQKAELKVNNFTIFKNDVFKGLVKLSSKFDVIFADPPYDLKNILDIPDAVFKEDLMKEDAWLIVEHSKHTIFDHPRFVEHREYGGVNFSIFK